MASNERELGEFAGNCRLCSRIRLWELPDRYVLEPTDGFSPAQCLAISRANGEIVPLDHVPSGHIHQRVLEGEAYGVAGIIRLLAGAYILVVTGREEVGSYRGSPVYKVTRMQFLYCNQRLGDVSPEERRDEAHYISLLKVVETFPGLYFSYDADLTRTAQAATMARSELHRLPLHQQAESRFLWNEYLLQEFTNSKLDPFIVPIIQGNILLIQFPFFFLRSLYLSLSKYPHNRSFKEICFASNFSSFMILKHIDVLNCIQVSEVLKQL